MATMIERMVRLWYFDDLGGEALAREDIRNVLEYLFQERGVDPQFSSIGLFRIMRVKIPDQSQRKFGGPIDLSRDGFYDGFRKVTSSLRVVSAVKLLEFSAHRVLLGSLQYLFGFSLAHLETVDGDLGPTIAVRRDRHVIRGRIKWCWKVDPQRHFLERVQHNYWA